MYRQDSKIIQQLYKVFKKEIVNEMQSLPFFYISRDIEKEFTSDDLNDEGYRKPKSEYVVQYKDLDIIEQILPFKEFIVMDPDFDYLYVKYLNKNEWNFVYVFSQDNIYLIVKTELTLQYVSENNYMHDANSELISINNNTNEIIKPKLPQEDIKDIVKSVLINFNAALSFFKWAENKYAVKVESKNTLKKFNKNKPWKRRDLPHYIFINTYNETVRGEYEKGENRLETGHSRRAHWRKLTHPRYKNHPNYGGRIRIRDCWVGPLTWSNNNKIYTAIVKDNERNVSL